MSTFTEYSADTRFVQYSDEYGVAAHYDGPDEFSESEYGDGSGDESGLSDLLFVLDAVLDCCETTSSPRLRVFRYWCGELRGGAIVGRDGVISKMADDLGMNARTVRRHLNAITGHELLGRVFRYDNRSLAGREPDAGCP